MRSWRLSWKTPVCLACLAALSVGSYLWYSARFYRSGFPLDDAWIHQTYARNLVWYGEWSFIPGHPSAGSTAPLWSGLLAVGYLLRLAPFLWTFLLGGTSLFGLSLVGMRFFRLLEPQQPAWAVGAGLLLLFEWHLVWAAVSGMETIVFALLILGVFHQLAAPRVHWLGVGLLVGVGVWLRPDGVTLLAAAFLVIWAANLTVRQRLVHSMWLLLGFLLLALPYLAFNEALAGDWLPNTFFAKQAEYAIHRQVPLWQRWFSQAILLLIGPGVLLLPGFCLSAGTALRRRNWLILAMAGWVVGYLTMYALRLPVTYQHGRYLIPAMPVFAVLGVLGLAQWLSGGAAPGWRRILGHTWALSMVIIAFAFWFLGAKSYAQDVAIIETEMVDTAAWISANAPADTLIAAHDIGALGYFARRPLLDLAGLVSPDVIPFIRDEQKLAAYLDAEGADYLVTFPGWYPHLVSQAELVYQSEAGFSPAAGGENMAVYRWHR